MAGLYSGTTMRIKIGTKTIFHETGVSLDSNVDFKEATSKDITGALQVAGKHSWSVSLNSLVANDGTTQEDIATLFGYHINGTQVAVEFSTFVTGDAKFSGNAYVSSFKIDAQNEDIVTGDFSFVGDGALTESAVV